MNADMRIGKNRCNGVFGVSAFIGVFGG